MSSSYGNSMLSRCIRNTGDVYTQRLLKEKYVDQQQIDSLKPLPLHVRQWSGRVRLSCCHSPNNHEPPTRGPNPSQAILTPISDPAKATNKVHFCSTLCNFTLNWNICFAKHSSE